MEPNNIKNKSKPAIKLKSFALMLAATLFAVTVPAIASASQEDVESRIIQYAQNIDLADIQGNASIIQQIGNNNRAQVIQSHSGSYLLGNLAHIYQNGNNNQASIYQSNDSNIGIIFQEGNNHNAEIIQEGNKYEATIEQFGHRSDISLKQLESGSGLRNISVKQDNPSGYARPLSITTGQFFTPQSQ